MGCRGLLIVLLIAVLAVSSCSSARRYEVLSFFFDGVPPPGGTPADSLADPVSDLTTEREPRVAIPRTFVHPPYEEGDCDLCHDLPDGRTFRGGTALIYPVRELCTMCHDEKDAASLREANRWVHGPVAAGECTACHSPHQSIHPFMLRREPGPELCTYCHQEENVRDRPSHAEFQTAPCLDCHSPHADSVAVHTPPERSRDG